MVFVVAGDVLWQGLSKPWETATGPQRGRIGIGGDLAEAAV